MERLYKLAEGLNHRYPDGNEPFQMVTRLAEECGEIASEINHWENSGIKREKYGDPSKESLANEIKNMLSCTMQIAIYYGVQNELRQSVENSLAKLMAGGHIE